MATIRSIAEIRRELAAQQKQLTKLKAQRKKIAKQLAGIDSEIGALGGKPAKTKRKARKTPAKRAKRAKGRPSLADVLAQVLEGKGNVKVAEAARLAVKAGYKSKSGQFANIVSQTLSGDNRFKKIARGVYALGTGKEAAPKTKAKTAKKRAAGKRAGKKAPRKVTSTAAKKKTAKKAGGLKGLLVKVMAGKESMGVREAMEAVLAAGYKTKAKDFRFIVNQTLHRGEGFVNVERGRYALAVS